MPGLWSSSVLRLLFSSSNVAPPPLVEWPCAVRLATRASSPSANLDCPMLSSAMRFRMRALHADVCGMFGSPPHAGHQGVIPNIFNDALVMYICLTNLSSLASLVGPRSSPPNSPSRASRRNPRALPCRCRPPVMVCGLLVLLVLVIRGSLEPSQLPLRSTVGPASIFSSFSTSPCLCAFPI